MSHNPDSAQRCAVLLLSERGDIPYQLLPLGSAHETAPIHYPSAFPILYACLAMLDLLVGRSSLVLSCGVLATRSLPVCSGGGSGARPRVEGGGPGELNRECIERTCMLG